jgi:hypothetical protein
LQFIQFISISRSLLQQLFLDHHQAVQICDDLFFFTMMKRPTELKNVPVLIPNPAQLVRNVRSLIVSHKNDCPEQAVTGGSF